MPEEEAPSWRGRPVPPVLVMWFDQLMAPDIEPLFRVLAPGRYVDVILTTAHGSSAEPPQVVVK